MLQPEGVVAQGLYVGQQRPAIRREGHAAPVAHEQRHPQLRFQGRYGVADAGLCEMQLFRSPSEAAAGGYPQKHLIFSHVHVPRPPLHPQCNTVCLQAQQNFMEMMNKIRFTYC